MTQLNVGTVSLTNGSAVATFAGTDLVAAGVVVGAWLQLLGEISPLQVASVDSATQATLSTPYIGVTGAGKDFTLSWYFSSVYGFPLPQAGDINAAGHIARAIEEIDAQLGPRVDIVLGVVGDAEAARDKAQEWAENAEDTPVETGPDQFSAKHHALKAEASADTAEGHKDAAGGSATVAGDAAQSASDDADQTALDRIASAASAGTASDAATAAQTARDKSQQWADEAEDIEVESGKFSSLHHAAKAAASASSAAALVAGLGNVVEFRGELDASAGNYPASPDTGDMWRVTVAGTISGTDYAVGDVIFWDVDSWEKLGASGGGSGVSSVVFAERSASLTLTANVWTKVTGYTEHLDTESIFDPSTGRATPTEAGWYFVFAGGGIRGTANAFTGFAIYKNGAQYGSPDGDYLPLTAILYPSPHSLV